MYLAAMLRTLFLLAMAAGFSSCCVNISCDCFEGIADDIVLQFDTDSANAQQPGYQQAELRGAYAVRYQSASPGSPLDSVPLDLKRSSTFAPASFALNRLFSNGSGNDFTRFTYRIVVPQVGRRYLITAVETAGQTVEQHCCSCYQNTRKRLRLDGQPIVADGAVDRVTARLLR
jgi:hypothetical protein